MRASTLLTNSLAALCLLAAARACPLPPDSARAAATHIFTGQVIDVQTNWISGGMKYTFRVAQWWKQSVPRIIIVNSAFEKQGGFRFALGETYLVYAAKKFTLKTHGCAGNKPLAQAAQDLAGIGPGTPPQQSQAAGQLMWYVGIMGLAGLLFVAVVVLRRRIWPRPKGAHNPAP